MKVIQTLNGYLLIKPKPIAEAIPGIEIPDSVDKEKATVGTVVIGSRIKQSPYIDWIKVEPDQTVIFNAFAPRKVTHEGEECLLVNSEDVYAVIEV